MPRFFCETIDGKTATISGEDARHIARALRCRVGEELTLCDGRGQDYRCTITELDERQVTLAVQETSPSHAEPKVQVTLYQAMPKGDKAELIVQKAVELGVHRVVFTDSARCVARPDPKSMAKKLERLGRVSLEAAKQSGRGIVPQVDGLLSWRGLVAEVSEHERTVLFYENADAPLAAVLESRPKTLAVMVGSEGGWEPSEVEELKSAGAAVCTMGPRILRCETAPMWALSAIMYHYQE